MSRYAAIPVGGLGVTLSLVAIAVLWRAPYGLFGIPGMGGALIDIVFVLVLTSWSVVGTMLALRAPGNAVGWLFLTIGLAAPLAEVTEPAMTLIPATDRASPLLSFLLWAVYEWMWTPLIVALGLVIALVPDGRLPSRRWRPLLLLGAAAIVGSTYATIAGLLGSSMDAPEPVGVARLANLAMLLFLAGSALALAARFKRSQGVERQQLKWIAYAGVLVGIAVSASTLTYDGVEVDPLVMHLSQVLAGFSVGAFAIATWIAIARHRLYDIDVLIKRTIVYGSLTAVLGFAYIGSVLASQDLLRDLTGGSDIAVAASTLLVVALFQPIRARIQDAVDRRFYRSRYDAARTVEALSARLRDEVDIDAVRADLLDAVRITMQPTHVSVWLRGMEPRP